MQRKDLNVNFGTACRISTMSSSIIVAVFINRPEKSPYRLTEARILNVFDVLKCDAKILDHLIIFGDFNYPDKNEESLTSPEYGGSIFCTYSFKHSLMQLINEPTHKSGSLLDLVITNSNKSQICEVNNKCFSDHRCVCVTTNASLLESGNLSLVNSNNTVSLRRGLNLSAYPSHRTSSLTFFHRMNFYSKLAF